MRFLFAFALLLLIGRETYGEQPQNLRMAEIQVRIVKAKPEQIRDIFAPPGQPSAETYPSPLSCSAPSLRGIMTLSGIMTNEQTLETFKLLDRAKIKMIAPPQLLALSGRKARIENVRTIPFPSEYELLDANKNTVPTTFIGVPDGIIMEFTPVIEGETIDLEISLKLKKLNEFIESPVPAPASKSVWQPSFTTREVTTSVTMYSGNTAVLAQWPPEGENECMFLLISVREVPIR